MGALELLEDEGFPGIVALVDADFDRVLNRTYNCTNLILTDAHDLDLTIFLSPALQVCLNEHAVAAKFQAACNRNAAKAAEIVLSACRPISLLRLANESRGLFLNFRDMSFDFIDDDLTTFNEDAFVTEIHSNSKRPRASSAQIKQIIANRIDDTLDLGQITNGHDAAKLLGKALRSLLGNKRIPQSWGSEIESDLRLAFDLVAFRETHMYSLLFQWQIKNAPFRLLAET